MSSSPAARHGASKSQSLLVISPDDPHVLIEAASHAESLGLQPAVFFSAQARLDMAGFRPHRGVVLHVSGRSEQSLVLLRHLSHAPLRIPLLLLCRRADKALGDTVATFAAALGWDRTEVLLYGRDLASAGIDARMTALFGPVLVAVPAPAPRPVERGEDFVAELLGAMKGLQDGQ